MDAEKFLPSINAFGSSLKVNLLFGQPHGVGTVTMMDNTCAVYTFHQGRSLGVAAFYNQGGKLLRIKEDEVQWRRRSLGPVIWFEQHIGKVRLLLARVEGIEGEEVAVVRNGASPLFSRATLDGIPQGLPKGRKHLPKVRFMEEKGSEEIYAGKSLVSSFVPFSNFQKPY